MFTDSKTSEKFIMKVAVIMSVYIHDKIEYLHEAVNSLLFQSFCDFELYIKCDGSVSDECMSYLKAIVDPRVKVFFRLENKGLAFTLNELLLYVLKNENICYIARMDADDIALPNRFEKQFHFLENNLNVDIVGGSIDEFMVEKKTVTSVKYPLDHFLMKKMFPRRNPIAHVAVMFRKSYFEKAGFYPINTDKDEDTMFWLQGFLSGCCFSNIPDVLVMVRVSPNFYRRRGGMKKSYSDFKNRCFIIKSLNSPLYNYILVIVRFFIFLLPFPSLIRLFYYLFRK